MKRLLIVTIFFCVSLATQAQEKIVRDSLSTSGPRLELNSPALDKSLFLDQSLPKPIGIFHPELSIFKMPLLPDRTKNLDFSKYFNDKNWTAGTFVSNSTWLSPFVQNGVTFNQAAYRLNDRFVFGGSSFGAQSIFDAPKMNQNIQNMSVKGASMFMQYKVSDHFKIETRVSVTNPPSPWIP